jgi:hypothetical protein
LTVNTFKPLPWNSNVNREIPLHLTPLLPKSSPSLSDSASCSPYFEDLK